MSDDFEYKGVGPASTADVVLKANKRLVPRQITGTSGTLAQGDEDTGVECTNASAVSVTADQLVAGTVIIVAQAGAGKPTILAGSGVTLRAPDGPSVAAQYKAVWLWWRSATEVWVGGQAGA